MRRLFSFVAALLCLSPLAVEAIESPKQKLIDAILCKVEPLDVIREFVDKPPADSGITSTSWGEEMDERNVVIVEGGLMIGGAKTLAVMSQFDTTYTDFQGIVFAEFKGDYLAVVKELGLKEWSSDADTKIGKYISPRQPSEKDLICRPTVGLTPLDNGRFVLGCGWCNG